MNTRELFSLEYFTHGSQKIQWLFLVGIFCLVLSADYTWQLKTLSAHISQEKIQQQLLREQIIQTKEQWIKNQAILQNYAFLLPKIHHPIASEKITMVGTLQRESNLYALLSFAQGEIHFFKVGDYIGHARIVQIRNNSVALQALSVHHHEIRLNHFSLHTTNH